jgi:hypothetical protein
MADDKNSIYILSIACIFAIFLIVFFVNLYLTGNQFASVSATDSAGAAASIAKVPATLKPIMTVTDTAPCAYAGVRSKIPNPADCPS